MGIRRAASALVALAAIAALAACESNPETADTSPGPTAYERAYAAICNGVAPATPSTNVPGLNTAIEQEAWRWGFCKEDAKQDRKTWATPEAVNANFGGVGARRALRNSPPDCVSVRLTPAEPFCD
ncbi:exported hypothetical protein [Frankia sp. Hr75.2]|nr:exported hypothetical protein [Frankia sp. Hr75.2]